MGLRTFPRERPWSNCLSARPSHKGPASEPLRLRTEQKARPTEAPITQQRKNNNENGKGETGDKEQKKRTRERQRKTAETRQSQKRKRNKRKDTETAEASEHDTEKATKYVIPTAIGWINSEMLRSGLAVF